MLGLLVGGNAIGYHLRSDEECKRKLATCEAGGLTSALEKAGLLTLEKNNATCHTDLRHYKDNLEKCNTQLNSCEADKNDCVKNEEKYKSTWLHALQDVHFNRLR